MLEVLAEVSHLVCFILVLVRMFQEGHTIMAVLSIAFCRPLPTFAQRQAFPDRFNRHSPYSR